MQPKRKLAAIAATIIGLTTVGGTAAVSQSSASSQESDWHVSRFVTKTIRENDIGSRRFVGADVVRKHGEVVGYNSYTGRFFPRQERIVVRLGLALRGGVILGRVNAAFAAPGEPVVFRGPILGGSGRYVGIEGRIVATIPAGDTQGRARVTLRWRT